MLNKMAFLDAGVIRGVLSAAIPVVVLILKAMFGLDEDKLTADLSRLVDSIMSLWIAISLAYIAYSRAAYPTPPITETAVKKTAEKISMQSSETSKPEG